MCLIVCTERDKPLSEKAIQEICRRNDDGWGLMWIENNEVRLAKHYKNDPPELFKRYQAAKEFNPIIHVRQRTHGKIDNANTHPFYCGFGIFLMHNGVITGMKHDQEYSDTWHLVNDYIKPALTKAKNPHQLIRSPQFKEALEKLMGYSNRIIMGDRGGFIRFNEKEWYPVKEETSGFAGTIVSNQYAWDETFNKPRWYDQYKGLTKRERKEARRRERDAQRGEPQKFTAAGLGFQIQRAGGIGWIVGNHPQRAVAISHTGTLMWRKPNTQDYYDQWGMPWTIQNSMFWRAPDKPMVDSDEMASWRLIVAPTPSTTTSTALTVVHSSNGLAATPEVDDDDLPWVKGKDKEKAQKGKERYMEQLVSEFSTKGWGETSTLVYTKPDQACHLIRALYKRLQEALTSDEDHEVAACS